jgi:hypothetical protein
MALDGRNILFWPAPLRRAVDSIAVVLMQVYMLARGRAATSASPVVRTLAGRDEEAWRLAIREREIRVQQSILDVASRGEDAGGGVRVDSEAGGAPGQAL